MLPGIPSTMAVLYDHRGNPIRTDDLKREHAGATLGGIRNPYRTSSASGLTPDRLASLLLRADEGDSESYFALAEEMEERDPHYRSVLSTRKLGVSGAAVQVEAASDDTRDQEIADAVREHVVERDQFEGLITDLLDGLAKGISIVETMWDTKGKLWVPECYEWRDQRWFLWDRDTLKRPLLRSVAAPMGDELASFKYVVHTPKLKSGLPLRGGLARLAATTFMLKSYTLRDWATFCEVFGLPLRIGEYGPDATDEEKDTLMNAVLNIGIDAAAIVPAGMKIQFENGPATSGGDKLFQGRAEWLDRQVSKAVLGQTMTTDAGSSRAQSQTHDEVRLDLRQADARALRSSVNRDLIAPFVALNFGADARPPKIRIVIEEPEDLKTYMDTVKVFVDLGGRVEQSVVRDKLGLPDPDEDVTAEDLLVATQSASPPGTIASPPMPAPPAKVTPSTPNTPEPKPGEEPAALNRLLERIEKALNRLPAPDDVSTLAGSELDDWRQVTAPSIGDLLHDLETAKTPDEARAALERASTQMDLAGFTDALATAMLKARGLGDATDAVKK